MVSPNEWYKIAIRNLFKKIIKNKETRNNLQLLFLKTIGLIVFLPSLIEAKQLSPIYQKNPYHQSTCTRQCQNQHFLILDKNITRMKFYLDTFLMFLDISSTIVLYLIRWAKFFALCRCPNTLWSVWIFQAIFLSSSIKMTRYSLNTFFINGHDDSVVVPLLFCTINYVLWT